MQIWASLDSSDLGDDADPVSPRMKLRLCTLNWLVVPSQVCTLSRMCVWKMLIWIQGGIILPGGWRILTSELQPPPYPNYTRWTSGIPRPLIWIACCVGSNSYYLSKIMLTMSYRQRSCPPCRPVFPIQRPKQNLPRQFPYRPCLRAAHSHSRPPLGSHQACILRLQPHLQRP